ncbi:hypothetical protein ACPW7J_06025 [Ihubacter sp. rT4E-8]|uniref:hypothetical protein n=1 Tax=unclassified Ihubacter TaxID=2633299 RepID=UPI00137B2455
MSREWQQKRYKQFVLPDAVYFQCIWAVRDLYRMEQRIEDLQVALDSENTNSVSDCGFCYGGDSACNQTEKAELDALKQRTSAIREALDVVPEEYRSRILSNIILRTSSSTYPGKMWKYWKQRFLYIVAKKLAMF